MVVIKHCPRVALNEHVSMVINVYVLLENGVCYVPLTHLFITQYLCNRCQVTGNRLATGVRTRNKIGRNRISAFRESVLVADAK